MISNIDDLTGSLFVFDDPEFSHPRNAWNQYLREIAYFKANFTSSVISTFYVNMEEVSATVMDHSHGWSSSYILFSGGQVTATGSDVLFQRSSLSYLSEAYFSFDAPTLMSSSGASVNHSTMTVVGTFVISFSAGIHKRSVIFGEDPEESGFAMTKRFTSSHQRPIRSSAKLYFEAEKDKPAMETTFLDSKREINNEIYEDPQSFVDLAYNSAMPAMKLLFLGLVIVYLAMSIVKQIRGAFTN